MMKAIYRFGIELGLDREEAASANATPTTREHGPSARRIDVSLAGRVSFLFSLSAFVCLSLFLCRSRAISTARRGCRIESLRIHLKNLNS